MTGRDAFMVWAPAGARWADWVRPVPFLAAHASHGPNQAVHFGIPGIPYIAKAQDDVAVIVDTPADEGVREGIALAGLGFRPIPLYNGTSGQEGAMALVETHAIENALRWGAGELEKLKIPQNAPPAFLLDSNRTHRYKMNASIFDNSWYIYDQDMPPAHYLLSNGIRSIIVRSERIQKDLARILYKFQKKGIVILSTAGYEQAKRLKIRKPPRKHS